MNKSKRSAFFLSVLLPGLGDLYLHDWKIREWGSGRYFFATEVLLIAGHLYSAHRSDWLRNDYRAWAAGHAGVDWNYSKPSQYETNIGKFSDVYSYNEVQRRLTGTAQLYEEGPRHYWQWDSESHRKKYDRLRISSQKYDRFSQYLIFGVVVNHLLAGVNSLRQYRQMEKATGIHLRFRLSPFTGLGGRPQYGFEARLSREF